MATVKTRCGQHLGLCWGSVAGGRLFDLVRVAAENGLETLAITPTHVDELLAQGMRKSDIRSRLATHGIRVTVIDPLISPLPGVAAPSADMDPAIRRLLSYRREDCWRAAETVDALIINVAHFSGGPVEASLLENAVARLAEENYARGFASTFEFVPGTGVPNLASAARLAAASPHVRVMFDTWHFARSGGTLADIEALPPGVIGGVQINDWLPAKPNTPYVPMSGRLIPGDGCLPLAAILARIEANSPGLDVGIEVFSDDLAALGHDAAVRRLTAATRPILAAAG